MFGRRVEDRSLKGLGVRHSTVFHKVRLQLTLMTLARVIVVTNAFLFGIDISTSQRLAL